MSASRVSVFFRFSFERFIDVKVLSSSGSSNKTDNLISDYKIIGFAGKGGVIANTVINRVC